LGLVGRSSSPSDELDDFHSGAALDDGLGPFGLADDLAVKLDGYTGWFDSENAEQSEDRQTWLDLERIAVQNNFNVFCSWDFH
jgi:hypothetical protein